MRFAPILALAFASCLAAQVQILPLSQVKAGMKAIGRTVFEGSRIEEFDVEILGVLENAGPKQSIILARLSGGPMAHTGVLQGMSGSPVFFEGRLLGAVALSFPFSKDPVAGIRPIEEMLATATTPAAPRAVRAGNPFDLASLMPKPFSYELGSTRLTEIATPLWLGGFTRGAFEQFAPMLRAAGLEPVQGLSAGGRPERPMGDRSLLKPGSMISVQLMTGDLNVGADGTVTHIDGDNVFAFGHHFMATGDSEMPFARAEVMTLLASQNSSFKISSSQEWMGSITQDRTTAIHGVLGRKAALLPVDIRVAGRGGVARNWDYHMEMVNDRLLTPLLVQMAVYSAIDATERAAGLASISVRARLHTGPGQPPIPFENLYSAELGAPNMVSASLAAPVSAIMQGGFDDLKITRVEIDIEVENAKKQLQIESLWPSRREAEPGETIQLTALFSGENGQEMTKTVSYTIPAGAQSGPLYFTLVDGAAANLSEYRQFLFAPPRNKPQLLAFLNGLRPNTKAFVRIWRSEPSWQVQGETLPAPPPSLALLLGASAPQTASSKLDEIEMASGGYMMTGSKTAVVTVKR